MSQDPSRSAAPDEGLEAALRPRTKADVPLPRRLPAGTSQTREALEKRHRRLEEEGISVDHLAGRGDDPRPEDMAGRIEGFVGFARVPVGVVGPLRINGSAAHGDFFLPLATSEGSLLSSYQHTANVVNRVGGVSALCTAESVGRTPCFSFESLAEAATFAAFVEIRRGSFQEIVSETSRFCELANCRTVVLGRDAYVFFEFTTGDAAGQNMVTLATQAICTRLIDEVPTKPRRWGLEANLSGDKKTSAMPFLGARGKKVSAEVTLSASHVRRYFDADSAQLAKTWDVARNGSIMAGAVGAQANVANAVAALFIACGQDVACVSEASTALSCAEETEDGGLYVSVTMPNLIVGTVGGGTSLPTARECLKMMGCQGPGKARKLAEICASLALCGELAVYGAISSGNFAQAHATLGRPPAAD